MFEVEGTIFSGSPKTSYYVFYEVVVGSLYIIASLIVKQQQRALWQGIKSRISNISTSILYIVKYVFEDISQHAK